MKYRQPQRQQQQPHRRRPVTAAAAAILVFCTSLLLLMVSVVVDDNVAHALSVTSPPHQRMHTSAAALQQPMPGSDVWPSVSEDPTTQLFVRSDGGVDVELPDLPCVFDRILQVSPLARKVMTATATTTSSCEYDATPGHPWKLVESSPLAHIDKIDSYQGRTASAPLLRFRSTLEGPCLGECFASFVMDYDFRRQWDAQIDQVYEAHSVTQQLQQVQHHMLEAQRNRNDMNWGVCSRFGVGYCRTKASIVSPREQLTMCGIQAFEDGSCLIWGVEMDQLRHEPLMPRDNNGKKLTRAKSHLFCTTLSPRPSTASTNGRSSSSPPTFDVEYVLQLEIGGKIPSWISGPVVTENVKQLLRCAASFYAGTDPQRGLEAYLLRRARTIASSREEATDESSSRLLRPMETYMEGRRGLLMTF
jgi:hypothetical protein